MKKGQVSLFLAVGLVILVLIGVFVYFSEKGFKKVFVPEDVEQVRDYISACAEDAGKEGILLSSLFGGYAVMNENSLEGYVPYYYDQGRVVMPSLRNIERSISKIAVEELVRCVNLSEFDFEVVNEIKPLAKTFIRDNGVDVKIFYKVILKKWGIRYILDEPYAYSYNIRLKEIYSFVKKIIENIKIEPKHIDVDYLLSKNVKVLLDYYNNAVMFTILDEASVINEEALVFKFAVRYF